MNSYIYKGRMSHQRHHPVKNSFNYGITMLYLDLDEIEELIKSTMLWRYNGSGLGQFLRQDYHGDSEQALKEAVLDTVEARSAYRPDGTVRLLTHCRMYGILFNPVSFYYCYGHAGDLQFIVSEISNTPWLERHSYVLDCRNAEMTNDRFQFAFEKTFHISPFNDMDQHYKWQLSNPEETLSIHMENYESKAVVFQSHMQLHREKATAKALDKVLIKYPYMTAKVIGGIYWQALKLKIKGAQFYTHPSKRDIEGNEQYAES